MSPYNSDIERASTSTAESEVDMQYENKRKRLGVMAVSKVQSPFD
jgi:hypothetical protein